MIKITGHGITTEIHPSDLDLFKKAGYSVVVDEPAPEPEKEPEKVEPVAPVEVAKPKGKARK
jgi:hypothetical protein